MSPTRKPRPQPPARRTSRKKTATAPPRRIRPSAPAASSGLAPGMEAINTYLAVANVDASIAFLERAFGFTRGVVLKGDDGQPRYAEMRHGASVVMLIRKGDGMAPTAGAAALYTYVPDVDRAAAEAREAGAGVEDAQDRPWGDRAATITDPDGYKWVLATFKKVAPFSV